MRPRELSEASAHLEAQSLLVPRQGDLGVLDPELGVVEAVRRYVGSGGHGAGGELSDAVAGKLSDAGDTVHEMYNADSDQLSRTVDQSSATGE